MPNRAPQTPTACARSRGSVKTLVMIDMATGFIIEAPTACRTRNATRASTLGATLHSSDAVVNTLRPATNVRLRPSRSAIEPENNSRLASTTVYASTVHWSPERPASSSRPMDGRPTFTAVMSSPTMKRLREQMSRMPVRRRGESSLSITIMKVSRIALLSNYSRTTDRAMSSAAAASSRPSRSRRCQVQKSSASATSARAPGPSEPADEARGRLGDHHVGGAGQPRVELRDRRALAEHAPLHRRRLPVPAVERRQRGAQAPHRVLERERRPEVRRRALGHPVLGAGRQQRAEVGEVVVDGQPLHAGAAGDVGDRRPRDARPPRAGRTPRRRCGRASPPAPRRAP